MKLRGTSGSSAQFRNSSEADKAQLAQAARQFEALLMKQVVKSLQGPLRQGASGPGRGMYDTLADDALAQHLTRGAGTGIAKTLYRQWTGEKLPGDMSRRPAATNMGANNQGAQSALAISSTGATDPLNAQTTGMQSAWLDDESRPLSQMLPPDGTEAERASWPLGAALKDGTQRPLERPAPTEISNEFAVQPKENHSVGRGPETKGNAGDFQPLGWDDGRPLRDLLPPDGTENKLSLNNENPRHDSSRGGVLFRNGDSENGYQKPRRNQTSLNRTAASTENTRASRHRVLSAYRKAGG